MKPTIKTKLVYENFDTMSAKWVVENEFVSYDNLTINFLQIIGGYEELVSYACLFEFKIFKNIDF